jgi:hypothetical protein
MLNTGKPLPEPAVKLHIERPYVEAMVEAFPGLANLKDQLRIGHRVEVPLERLSSAELAHLGTLYQAAGPAMRLRAAQVHTLTRALADDGERFQGDNLEPLVPAIARYLARDAERGWLFQLGPDGRPLPFVLTRLDYTPPSEDETGKVFLELKANAKGKILVNTMRIAGRDADGRTVGEIFAAKGYFRETADMLAAYDDSVARYFDWRAQYGAQFAARGTGFYAEDPNATHRDTDWARKDVLVLSTSGGAARLVNDEETLANRAMTLEVTGDILGAYLRKAMKSMRFKGEDAAGETRAELPPGMFTRIPVHPYLFMFQLDLHHHVWVHVEDMQPYAYQPGLKDKLVLPREQTDLIDILTAEMDVLMDDIVAGKSGGTTVLCAGPAGVGKTLTAEVYSEIIGRPLYRVHSGQLGLNVAAMEATLKDILTRAQRWGAIMLIDEADVYIRRRDDNMAANAVVGVFLRVLEYFNGLLFLTTNRIDDIDEAIVSRCIALIRYHAPDTEGRRQIWRVMTEQFGLPLAAGTIAALADTFPTATGRDIKGLAKLVAKFCSQKRVAPELAVFRRCATFRGLDPVGEAPAA